MTDTSLRRHLSHNVEGRCLPYKKTSIRRINLNTDTSMDGHFYMSGRGIFIENLLFKTINYSKPQSKEVNESCKPHCLLLM